MKILHVIGGGDVGGSRTHIFTLLSNIKDRADIKLVCLRDGDFANGAKALGIDTEVVSGSNIYASSKKVSNIIDRFGADIVHSHGAKANIVAIKTKKKHPDIKYITTLHSDYAHDYDNNLIKKLTIKKMNKKALRKMDYYQCVSADLKDKMVERYFPEDYIFTLPNGFDFSSVKPSMSKSEFLDSRNITYDENVVYVGILARLTKVKGVDVFIRAAASAIKRHKNIEFLIAGDGEDIGKLKALTNDLNIYQHVHFLGYVNNPIDFLNAIDINVISSHTEGFPYSIIEGAALRKATIASDVGGISTLVQTGKTGILFEDNDHFTLAQSICYLADSSVMRDMYGDKIYDKAKQLFSLDRMIDTQYNIYDYLSSLDKDDDTRRLNIMGVPVMSSSMDSLLNIVKYYLKDGKKHSIFTPNAEMIMAALEDKDFMEVLKSSDFNLPDGSGVVLASKIIGFPIKGKIAGVDFSSACMDLDIGRKIRIYLFGGKPGIAEAAAENLEDKHPNIEIVGMRNGYFTEEDSDSIIYDINRARADFLLVALGCPKQEKWIYENISKINSKVSIGVGGSLDVFAGQVKRAPKFFIKFNLEWLYRLIKEPKRIGRMMKIPKFLIIAIWKRFTTE